MSNYTQDTANFIVLPVPLLVSGTITAPCDGEPDGEIKFDKGWVVAMSVSNCGDDDDPVTDYDYLVVLPNGQTYGTHCINITSAEPWTPGTPVGEFHIKRRSYDEMHREAVARMENPITKEKKEMSTTSPFAIPVKFPEPFVCEQVPPATPEPELGHLA